MSNFQHRPIASLADPQPKWRVYGLNKEHVLIVSLKPALYTSDGECQLLLREEDENQDEWIPSLRTAHKQVHSLFLLNSGCVRPVLSLLATCYADPQDWRL